MNDSARGRPSGPMRRQPNDRGHGPAATDGALPDREPFAASRRALLVAASLAAGGVSLRAQAAGPAALTAEEAAALRAALLDFSAGAVPREGRVQLELPEIVENGNAVPVTVTVDSPMSAADRVVAIGLFCTRNPAPEVAKFRLGADCPRAQVATRMRLATSQTVVAVARMADGSAWSANVDVLVTLAACVEG